MLEKKSNHTKKCLASAILLSSVTSISHANFLFDPSNHQEYLSFNVGMPYANSLYQGNMKMSGFKGVGTSIFLGSQTNRIFGPEVAFQYNSYNNTGETFLVGAMARGTLNLNEIWNVFGKLGVGYGQARVCNLGMCTTEGNMVPLFGGGIGAFFTKQWLSTLEFNGAYFTHHAVHNADGVFGALTLGITRFFDF